MVGNHRDAWGFGALDPNSGTAQLMEVRRREQTRVHLCAGGASVGRAGQYRMATEEKPRVAELGGRGVRSDWIKVARSRTPEG